MGAVIDPFPSSRDPLVGSYRCRVPDEGDQFTMTARCNPQDTESVLSIVERHSLDDTRQSFPGRTIGLRPDIAHFEIARPRYETGRVAQIAYCARYLRDDVPAR